MNAKKTLNFKKKKTNTIISKDITENDICKKTYKLLRSKVETSSCRTPGRKQNSPQG